ncbi:MAG: hypothetical protein M1532_03385 [Nitrospirae bacterium]|nr:hypothetical protein [Nitrospirota bacterium]
MKALTDRDVEKAKSIIARDHQVNAMEVGIDEDCIRMIALHQPEWKADSPREGEPPLFPPRHVQIPG